MQPAEAFLGLVGDHHRLLVDGGRHGARGEGLRVRLASVMVHCKIVGFAPSKSLS